MGHLPQLMAYTVTVTSTKLIINELGIQVRFDGRDIIKATATNALIPQVNTSPREYIVQLTLTGDAAMSGLPNPYIIKMSDVSNQPTWTNDTAGCNQAAADISVMIRSVASGGGGGQVDTIVAGDAIDVDSTDPVNPIVNVLVDGVTIGFNGLNQLEVPAGGGGYVPTTRTINTTAPLTGGGNLSANRTIGIPQANGSTDGFLDSADWTTFNNKGDVNGPGSSADNNIALFDGATGKLIKDSGYTPGQIVIPTGFGDIDLVETSPGFWPVEIKGGLDGDGTTMQSNTGSFQVNVNPKNSIEVDAAQVQLVGDEASPGNSEYYGTNGAGAKGFHPLSASSITSPQALTRVDDTNVTLTLGGTPSTALLQAASITVGWAGQLAISRGGTNASTEAAALTNLGILRAMLSSAFVTNSASFVDVTGLAITVPAGKTARFTAYIPYSSATTTVGIGLSMTITGSPLLRHFTRFTPTNGTGTPVRAQIIADDGGAVNATTASASTNYGIEMNGIVVADASPCVVQLRMSVGGTPANITLAAGSSMIATLID